MEISPLAPPVPDGLPPVAGVRLFGIHSGLKKRKTPDLMMAELAEGTSMAGVLTRSRTCSAPVLWCREALRRSRGRGRAIVVNSGNSNAFTGKAGVEVVDLTVASAAELVGCKATEVYVASTGVIGQPVPKDHIPAALPGLYGDLSEDGWRPAADAIMTTDTFAKLATRETKIGDATVRLNGFAKGSGMIAPDMATMLAFVFTDAAIPPNVLQSLLARGADRSFNSITVDGDTSTSDTLLLAATGQAPGQPKIRDINDPRLRAFRKALDDLLIELAQLVAKDGEGAQKFVTINVTGATSRQAARRIGLAIANSPLVKTAIAGEDANWGRIVMAVGKSGEEADRDRLEIAIGGVPITEGGRVRGDYDEGPVADYMKGREIVIDVDVGAREGKGRGKATVWTCDLTHGYISINADYRS